MTSNIVGLKSAITSCIESVDDFSVGFNDAWQWAGYGLKANALRKLKNHFVKGVDFSSDLMKNPGRGRSSVSYHLTTDCFKAFCMMAGTVRGREVRQYFIECEKELKLRTNQPVPDSLAEIERAITAVERIESVSNTALREHLTRCFLGTESPVETGKPSDQTLLLKYLQKHPEGVKVRNLTQAGVLRRRGVKRAGEYRERLDALKAVGKVRFEDGRYYAD